MAGQRSFLVVILAVVLVSCDTIQGALNIPDTQPVAVELDHPELRLTPGEKVRLRATLRNKDWAPIAGTVEWQSLDQSLGVVDTAGWVTALTDSGVFDVVARAGDVSATTRVRLVPAARCRPPLPGEAAEVSIFGVQVLQSIEVVPPVIPLITGRPATVRVSLLSNTDAPLDLPADVEVRVVRHGSTVGTVTAHGPACLPHTPRLAQWSATFNAEVPAAWIHGDLEFHVTALVGEGGTSPTELNYTEGSGSHYRVFEPPPFDIVFVPVALPKFDIVAEFADDSTDELLLETHALFPLDEVTAAIREPFAYGGIDSLEDLLPMIRELRLMDESTAYYHALVPDVIPEPVAAGMGYYRIPASWSLVSPPNAENGYKFVGWGMTIAHELGHNFDLRHGDCGGPDGALPGSPYVYGRTGTYGINGIGTSQHDYLVQPDVADVMTYCGPKWISDRNYRSVMTYRTLEERNHTELGAASATTVMLVSGQSRNGVLALRPAFAFEAVPQPPQRGEWAWQLLDAEGRVMKAVSFTPDVVALTEPDEEIGFGFTVGVTQAELDLARRARVLDPTGAVVAETVDAAGLAQAGALPPLNLERAQGNLVTLTWDATTYPAVVVRDADSRAVLTRGEGGSVSFVSAKERFEVLLSTGVGSVRVEVR